MDNLRPSAVCSIMLKLLKFAEKQNSKSLRKIKTTPFKHFMNTSGSKASIVLNTIMILKLLALCAVVGMSASEACGGAVSGTTGTIQFPSVPGRYPHSTKCEWIITTPPETRVHLTFSYFYLERKYEGRCYDFFVIRDGDNWKSPKLSKRLCGFKTPSDVTATGNVMYLKFKSDHYHNFWGFHATWSSQPAANETSGSLE